ncbi:hypothetical protein [Natronomonas marina]|jgi:hypothetical protein|uniref:hypothetical protein n=1 Tax=Natronomonas marina TaxID=2961939 RepID=UPI0020C98DDA|nr:hypothetical protein [Natronomonas marina]
MEREIGANWHVGTGKVREYWSWTGGALYLLFSLDLLTTLYAAALYGVGAEANPFVRQALSRGVPRLLALNLAGVVVTVALLAAYIRLLERTRGVEAWVMARSFELWVGGLLAAGLFVFANNLSVIVLGGSLV